MAVVPVFVSSTFRDFHGERDILAGPVRERLDELIAPLGMRVELIDLRWGVDTLGVSDDDAAAKVLDVCLAEVKRARPLFLGLLGDRLGYVPAALHARTVASQVGVPQTQPVEGLSVTALEFGFGLLWDVAPAGDHVVVFRDLIGQPPPGWADPDPAAVEAFRHEVAAAVRDRFDVVVAEYTADVESGTADLVTVRSAERTLTFEDLLVDLLAEPVTRRATSLAEQQAATGSSGSERLFRDDHEIIVGRDEMVAQVVDTAATGGRVVLAGESGSGKSTVLCAAERVLRERGITVVSSLLGASTTGASARALIEHLMTQLNAWTGSDVTIPTDLHHDDLARCWSDKLTDTVSAAGTFVIMVDALDASASEPERSDIWPVLHTLAITRETAGARTAYPESLDLARQLQADQPDANQPVEDLAVSLALVAGILDADDMDSFTLRFEERELRAEIFTTLKDFQSALTWARLNLIIDASFTAHPPPPSETNVIAFHGTVLDVIAQLLEMLDNVEPLADDLRAELTRVRQTLAEFPDLEETRQ